jgi:hypothetical protein
MSRSSLLALIALGGCAPDYVLAPKDDDPGATIDTDAGIPLDTDRPHHHRHTDPPEDSGAPPGDDSFAPDDTDVPDTDVPPVDTDVPPVDTDTAPPVATYSMYAHTSDTLFSVDPAQNLVSRIGTFRRPNNVVVSMADIAIDLGGHLFAGSYDATTSGNHTIYSVDPTTARITWVCDVPLSLIGMTFLSDGRLVVGADHTLTVVDLSSHCAQSQLYSNANWTTSGDVVGLPDGYLYWTVTGPSNDLLVRVDPAQGTASVMGTTAVTSLYGLGYDDTLGVLYGFSANSGRIHVIDPATAHTTRVPGGTSHIWWGATTNPVVW